MKEKALQRLDFRKPFSSTLLEVDAVSDILFTANQSFSMFSTIREVNCNRVIFFQFHFSIYIIYAFKTILLKIL